MPKNTIVYINQNQDLQIESLLNNHNSAKIIISTEKLSDLIKKLRISLGDNQKFLKSAQITRDGLLGSLRRVDYAFSECQKAPINKEGHDIRESMSLVFFHNAKCFFEITKKNFPQICKGFIFNITSKEITIIRNYFAHSYEKDFLEESKNTFVRLNINHHMKGKKEYDELFELEIFDIEESRHIFSIYFSLEIFLMEIQIFIKSLISYIEKNTPANSV